jgi:hypothetical protein
VAGISLFSNEFGANDVLLRSRDLLSPRACFPSLGGGWETPQPRRVYSSFWKLREVKSLSVLAEFIPGVHA